jgi:hypothetical protein
MKKNLGSSLWEILAIFGVLEKLQNLGEVKSFSGKQANSNIFSRNDKFGHFKCFWMS